MDAKFKKENPDLSKKKIKYTVKKTGEEFEIEAPE